MATARLGDGWLDGTWVRLADFMVVIASRAWPAPGASSPGCCCRFSVAPRAALGGACRRGEGDRDRLAVLADRRARWRRQRAGLGAVDLDIRRHGHQRSRRGRADLAPQLVLVHVGSERGRRDHRARGAHRCRRRPAVLAGTDRRRGCAFNAAHRGDPCAEQPCGARYAAGPVLRSSTPPETGR